jgi:hypothetical protein
LETILSWPAKSRKARGRSAFSKSTSRFLSLISNSSASDIYTYYSCKDNANSPDSCISDLKFQFIAGRAHGKRLGNQKKDLLNGTAPREEKNDAGRQKKGVFDRSSLREEMRDGRASKERSFEQNSSARGKE